MAIIRPTPPAEIEAAWSEALPSFLAEPTDGARMMEQGYVDSLPPVPTLAEVGDPRRTGQTDGQPIFVLSLSDAAKDAGVRAATPAGWRFFAGSERGRTVLGRVSRRPGAGWKMTAVYYGDRAWETMDASHALDSLPQARDADYELRVLAVPGLNLEAFWLAAQAPGTDDLAVPYPAMPAAFQEREAVYTMPHFLAVIRPVAIQQMNDHTVSR